MYLNNKGKDMNLIKTLAVFTFSVVLIGCGSSSDSTTSEASTPVVDEASISVTQDPVIIADLDPILEQETEQEIDLDAVYSTTAELVAAKSFLLKPEYDLQVSYVNTDNQNIYLSVCTDFEEAKSGIKVNYESCLLRTSITESFQANIIVPNDKNRIVMAIWDLDNPQQPRYETWEYSIDPEDEHTFTVN